MMKVEERYNKNKLTGYIITIEDKLYFLSISKLIIKEISKATIK